DDAVGELAPWHAVARAVGGQREAEPLAAVQQVHLRPQVDESVGRGRPGEPGHVPDDTGELARGRPAGGVAGLGPGQLVEHQRAEAVAERHGGGDVVPADGYDVRSRLKSGLPSGWTARC